LKGVERRLGMGVVEGSGWIESRLGWEKEEKWKE